MFQSKLFDVAAKYGQGHLEWYEQLEFSELYHYAHFDILYHHSHFDIYHIYGVWADPNVNVFDKLRHLTDQKHAIIFLECTSESAS